MNQRTHIIKKLSLGAAIASLSTIAFAQADLADVAAPPDNPLVNMPAEIIKAPDASNLTTPQPSAAPPEATLLAPLPAGSASPDSVAANPDNPELTLPSEETAPSQIGASPQPLGVPQDRSKEDEYRRAMDECSSKNGVELKACQDMVNSDYHVNPNSIRLSDLP